MSCLKDLAGYGGVEIIEIRGRMNLLTMKRLVLFLAVAILSGLGLQSCDREENNGSDNNGGVNGSTTVKWVDLGLPSGLLWADRNIGASKPENYGNYYAWGETSPKEDYYWTNYAYGNATEHSLTKYCCHPNYGLDGFIDYLNSLEASDDAATVNLGGESRMPNIYDWQELIDNTTRTWTTRNGTYGLLLTASNGKKLFLPAAGNRFDSNHGGEGEYGDYWSSSLGPVGAGDAWVFFFITDNQGGLTECSRNSGCSVRAVRTRQR